MSHIESITVYTTSCVYVFMHSHVCVYCSNSGHTTTYWLASLTIVVEDQRRRGTKNWKANDYYYWWVGRCRGKRTQMMMMERVCDFRVCSRGGHDRYREAKWWGKNRLSLTKQRRNHKVVYNGWGVGDKQTREETLTIRQMAVSAVNDILLTEENCQTAKQTNALTRFDLSVENCLVI
jgi:hypothetical protein